MVRGLPAALYRRRLGPRMGGDRRADAGHLAAVHRRRDRDRPGARTDRCRGDRRGPVVGPVLPARRACAAAPRGRPTPAGSRARADARDVTPRPHERQPRYPNRGAPMSQTISAAATRRDATPGLRGKNVSSRAAARDRTGDRSALRRVRRQRGDQLPQAARGGPGDPGDPAAGSRLRARRHRRPPPPEGR